MFNKSCYIGLDTSNYTTSIAAVDSDFNVIADQRRPLRVKIGGLGLRQSEALFQHMENLPDMLENLFQLIDKDQVRSIAASNKPRPIEGSYMPVFNAGRNYGKVLRTALDIPLYFFSHQEGHLEAAIRNSSLMKHRLFVALHLSGGTTEVLNVEEKDSGYNIAIIGGTKDISFGQLIDRIGVSLSFDFPCGEAMDQIAINYSDEIQDWLKPIRIEDLAFNLSGIETQCKRLLASGCDQNVLIYDLFYKISTSLCRIAEHSVHRSRCNQVLFIGGVSASRFIRTQILEFFKDKELKPIFGDSTFSSDNAAGIAILGAKAFMQNKR